MAASPVPESMPGTSTQPTNTPTGTDSQPELRRLKLNNEWMIGEPIEKAKERHSAVYSVLSLETGQFAEDLEAHVFSLRNIEPKLRKYRQRCIKRMKGRTKLKVEIDNVTIVIITTSKTESASVPEHGGGGPHSLDRDGRQTDNETNPIDRSKQKTLFQLEMQHIRQRERRQAKRPANKEQSDGKNPGGKHIFDIDTDSWHNEESPLFTSLVHELLDDWDWWEISAMYTSLATNEDSGLFHEVYNEFLLQTAAAMRKIEELEDYLDVRRSEIMLLRSLRTRMMR